VSLGTDRVGFGAALAITCTLAIAAVLALMAIQLSVIHPGITGFDGRTGLFNQQSQTVKTDLYIVGFAVILPGALLVAAWLVSRILAGPNAAALTVYSTLLSGSLAGVVILIRLSSRLPWGSGVTGVLVGVMAWIIVACGITWMVLSGRRWSSMASLEGRQGALLAAGGAVVFGVLLSLTSESSISAVPIILGTAIALAVIAAYGRVRLPSLGRWGRVLDAVVVVLLLLAIPDLVVFHRPSGVPIFLVGPGLVQFQQDWLLGPTNQLLAGGALLVNDPVSQYGVGLLYFLAGWFRLAPIGYGTLGFLDGLLTALFYIAGYSVLRLAGVRRLLAASAIGLGVLVLPYNFHFFVGQLPEEGPLRFGLPMLVILAEVAGIRWPRWSALARFMSLFVLAVSAIWALEAFAYTTVTYLAALGAKVWLAPRTGRRRAVLEGLGLGAAAILLAHATFVLATLAATGQLPDWQQYLAYVHALLLGGKAGQITFGFADWSPGLAVYAGGLVSAAAVVLLVRYRSAVARRSPRLFVAVAAMTAYSIALLSYTDNRSSTYLFLYVSLPLLLSAALWLGLIFSEESRMSSPVRRGALTAALAVAVLLLSGAWPSIGSHFSRTALARAYPGGGFLSSLHRLWHPPPIDPRSPVAIRLLDRYAPGRRAIILLPTAPDLGTEILMRSGRANLLPIGDPKADSFVPSVWLPRMRAAVERLKPGQRVLVDRTALAMIAKLRRSHVNVVNTPVYGGSPEIEWILRALDERFKFVPIHRGPYGLEVDQLVPR
jgi:hypothetical protein